MKKTLIVAVICCALPIIIITFLFSQGNQRVTSSNQQTEKTVADDRDASVGKTFPSFNIIDVDGLSITNEVLKGKPTILWFTTTWCTPCQIGAKKVAKLQSELGDNKLNVLVFFVDLRETADDLRNWRSKFANPDWKLAFDNGLAEKIGIKFLDSKYLLDKNGVIKDFNTQIVNQQYLDLIKLTVK